MGPPAPIAAVDSTGVTVAVGPGLFATATLIGLAESVDDDVAVGVGVGPAVTLGVGVGAAVGDGGRGVGVAAAAGAAFGGIGWIDT